MSCGRRCATTPLHRHLCAPGGAVVAAVPEVLRGSTAKLVGTVCERSTVRARSAHPQGADFQLRVPSRQKPRTALPAAAARRWTSSRSPVLFASNAASGFWQLGWMCGGQSKMRPLWQTGSCHDLAHSVATAVRTPEAEGRDTRAEGRVRSCRSIAARREEMDHRSVAVKPDLPSGCRGSGVSSVSEP